MSLAAVQLLQGPTRLAVGVLSGAAAADLLFVSPARCYVARPAYDDEVFQSLYGGTLRERQLASPKPKRPVGVAAAARIVTPGHLAVTLGRNVGLTVLVTFNKWLLAALEEEEAAEAEGRESAMPPLEVEELTAACVKGAYNACVDLAVQGTRCALDAAAVEHLQPALSKKLIKDLRQSVVRKARLPWYSRVPRVAKTALCSDATFWAADFLVSCCLEAYHAAKAARAKLVGWQLLLQRVALRCGIHAARAGLVLAAVAAGNGLGSASPRARGFAMWLLSMAASFLVNGYMLSFMNRMAPLAGPPPGSSAGAGVGARAPPGRGFVTIGQQVHPAAAAAMAAAAAAAAGEAAAAAAGEAAAGVERLANGVAADRVQAGPGDGAEVLAGGGGGAGAVAARAADAVDGPAVAPAVQQDAGMQAGPPGAAEPPIPAPQQRRVVGGPRLPERPARRNAAAGPDASPASSDAPSAVSPAPTASGKGSSAASCGGSIAASGGDSITASGGCSIAASGECSITASGGGSITASGGGSIAASGEGSITASGEGSSAGVVPLADAGEGQQAQQEDQEEQPHGGGTGVAAPADVEPAA